MHVIDPHELCARCDKLLNVIMHEYVKEGDVYYHAICYEFLRREREQKDYKDLDFDTTA